MTATWGTMPGAVKFSTLLVVWNWRPQPWGPESSHHMEEPPFWIVLQPWALEGPYATAAISASPRGRKGPSGMCPPRVSPAIL